MTALLTSYQRGERSHTPRLAAQRRALLVCAARVSTACRPRVPLSMARHTITRRISPRHGPSTTKSWRYVTLLLTVQQQSELKNTVSKMIAKQQALQEEVEYVHATLTEAIFSMLFRNGRTRLSWASCGLARRMRVLPARHLYAKPSRRHTVAGCLRP